MPPDPPCTSPAAYCYSATYAHAVLSSFLDNKLLFIRKLKNADQIYSYLMKLKLNKCIGPNSNCRQLYNKKKNTFTLSVKKSSLSCWK